MKNARATSITWSMTFDGKINRINKNSPADNHVTGGFVQKISALELCYERSPFLDSIGAIDAPEWLPSGEARELGRVFVLREYW